MNIDWTKYQVKEGAFYEAPARIEGEYYNAD